MSRESNPRLNLTIPATYESGRNLSKTCAAMYKNLGVTHQKRGAPAYLAVLSPELRDAEGALLATGKSEILGKLQGLSPEAWAEPKPAPQTV